MKRGKIMIICCILLSACSDYTPKPTAYFRIDLPEPDYHTIEFQHFNFKLSKFAQIITLPSQDERTFFNIAYPQLNVQIYCSYIPIKNGKLVQLSEECRKFAFLHAAKAEAIRGQMFENKEQKVFGIQYDIQGNVASPAQFALTDSIRSFFRGVLYFDNTPNQDSIAPVLEYINNDILMLIESFRWKK